MRAPLAMGLGAVFAASLAGMFLPPTSALGAGEIIACISLLGSGQNRQKSRQALYL